MSDPFIRAKRPSLGSQRPSSTGKAAAKSATPSDAQVAEAHLRSSGPTGTREKLNHFLSKLETTWKLFNRSSTDSADGELPEQRLALLDEGETPTPETLKKLRARFKETAQKPEKSGSSSLYKSASPEKRAGEQKQKPPGPGPKQSPASDRNTPKPPTQRSAQPEAQSKSQPQTGPKPSPSKQSGTKPPAEQPAQQKAPSRQASKKEARAETSQRFEGPRVEKESTNRPAQRQSSGGSVLGRKPGSQAAKSSFSSPKPAPQQEKPAAQQPKQQSQAQPNAQPQSRPPAQRGPQLLRRPGTPRGHATSKSFLGSAQSGAQMRSSDAAGRPGRAAETHVARQPVFSQSLGQVNKQLKKRQVSSQMPVHNSFLDECHEGGKKESGPIRLTWGSSNKTQRSIAQRMFAHRGRLQLTRGGQSGGQSLGNPINMNGSQASLASARTDVSTRVAGAAIGSLLEDLYEEEEVENLDEETAVTSLGLILRLGGEFTYKHSTRVLDLALELADEVGIRDKQTRKEIKFGTMLRDVGEFDILLQASPDAINRMSEFSDFLQGQDMLRAGLLHDIGKVKIPPEILYKPGKLTPEEYEIMKMHPIWGEDIVRPIASLRYLCPTIRGHHERWDGKGYPDGLAGDKIPLAARIISVADVFDALAAERPYKRGMEVNKVTAILSEGRGSHFDPFLVDSFLEVLRRRYPDT